MPLRAADVVILSVPFEHTAGTVKALAEALSPGQIVVSMGVPLATAIGDGAVRTVGVWQGSCAELVASLVPEGVAVVSAFQNVAAHRLQDLAHEVECDVIVSGAKAARERVMALCRLIPGLRPVDGGPLANARYVRALVHLERGAPAAAAADLEKALAAYRVTYPEGNLSRSRSEVRLARAYLSLGRAEEAASLARDAVAFFDGALPEGHRERTQAHETLAEIERRLAAPAGE